MAVETTPNVLHPSNPAPVPDPDSDVDEPETGAKPAEKTFTQDEVNKILSQNKKALKAKAAEADAARQALEKRIAEIEAKTASTEPKPEDKTADGRLEAAIKRLEKELETQKGKNLEVEARAEKAEKRRQEALRDRALDEALTAAGCIDMKVGRRTFLPDVLDKDEDGVPLGDDGDPKWAIKLPSGTLADLSTAIAELLPKYLRNPSGNVGGAGTVPGKSKDKSKIEEMEKKLQALKTRAQNTGRNPDIAAYDSLKRQLNSLKASQTK